MTKLNRQQLGSSNWGQSINENWSKIENQFGSINNQVQSLKTLIEDNQFGIAFGGFLRLDRNVVVKFGETSPITHTIDIATEAAKRGEIWVTKNATDPSLLFEQNGNTWRTTAEVIKYTVGDIISGEKTNLDVPVNRVFRVCGEWNPSRDWDPEGNWATGETNETIKIEPYDMSMDNGGLVVYTATQFQYLFWNSRIYQPQPILQGTKIVFEPVIDYESQNVSIPYPSALCESVSQWVKLKSYNQHFVNLPSIGLINGGIEENNGALVKYTSVKFVTLSNSGNTYEEFSMWHQLKNIGNNEFILEWDADAILTDNDYAIITYFGSPTVYEDVLGKLNKLNDGSSAIDPNAGSATTGIGE